MTEPTDIGAVRDTRNYRERDARRYCAEIGADPDVLVDGFVEHEPVSAPRWQWYQLSPGERRYRTEVSLIP